MALRFSSHPLSSSHSKLTTFFYSSRLVSRPSSLLQWRPRSLAFPRRRSAVVRPRACEKLEEKNVLETGIEWGKVSAVLFDMDGVLCNSEEPSRMAAVDVFAEMGVEVSVEDFVPFMGTGEANFLGGVASVKGVEGFNTEAAKKRFFEIYLDKYAKPNSGIGFPGAFELINQFTVVGVHSAKFDNEKDLEAIRNAVLRYGITHPVVNDGDMYLWHELGINSWPTFAIVGPNGKLLAQLSGEGRRKDLDDLVEAALLFYGGKKMLDTKPIPLSLEKDNDPRLLTSPLKFPGKLAVDVLNNRLFISDSNHNRIESTRVLSCHQRVDINISQNLTRKTENTRC